MSALISLLLSMAYGMIDKPFLSRRNVTTTTSKSFKETFRFPSHSFSEMSLASRSLRPEHTSSTLPSQKKPSLNELTYASSNSSLGYGTFSSGPSVQCITGMNNDEFRLIEVPYFYEIQTFSSPNDGLLTEMESFSLSVLAENMLSCYSEEIRLLSISAEHEHHSRVVAAYSSSSSIISDQYTCSISNIHVCSIVEGAVTLAVEGGSDSEDVIIAEEALDALRLALSIFDSKDIISVNFFGNSTTIVSLVNKFSQRGGMSTTDDDDNEAGVSFLVISVICSLLSGVLVVVLFLSVRNDDSNNNREDDSIGDTCSISIVSSREDCMSEFGCYPPPSPKL